jgi:hypothetical protein
MNMHFDPDAEVVKLCARGMDLEGQARMEEAHEQFLQAWQVSSNDLERFTAAHYVARNQKDPAEKLRWNQDSLKYATCLSEEEMRPHFPSLYLNIAKSFEDLSDPENAIINYRLALEWSIFLPEGGYGKMIRSGIREGLKRMESFENNDGL